MQSSRAKIRAYIIFNRHGHRAPGRNVMLGGALQEEKELWQSCVVCNDNDDNESLSVTIKQHPTNGIARDLITHPFGCITKRGRDYLEAVGKKVSNFFPSIKTVHSDNLMVYSTNYQRTQVGIHCSWWNISARRRCRPHFSHYIWDISHESFFSFSRLMQYMLSYSLWNPW